MDSNTSSTERATGLDRLAAAVDELAGQDLAALPEAEAAARVLVLRGLLERLEGQWRRELAALDARGAAGAEDGVQAASTAGWLRSRARLGAADAAQRVRVARALHRGPLAGTAQALAAGEISWTHAAVLARGTQDLRARTAAEAEPVLLDAARRLDPPRLRRVVAHLRDVAEPETTEARARRQHEQRGLWLSPTFEGMVAVDGLLEAEAGETLLAALDPPARPGSADDQRSTAQRRADALTELARRALEGGALPHTGGVRPQVTVTVELAALLGGAGLAGGEGGWALPLPAEAARRLVCDAAVTRAVVARDRGGTDRDPTDPGDPVDPGDPGGLAGRLRAAVALLPPALGGAPSRPLDLGRTARWSRPRSATPWRCATAAACSRTVTGRWPGARRTTYATGWPAAPPTPANLVLLCRAHHRAVHEGGWRIDRHADGALIVTPPHRRQQFAA